MAPGALKIDVSLGFSAGVRIVRPGWAPRRATAILAIFAISFQAILCAWHHHAYPLSLRAAGAVVAVAAATGEQLPASADENCQICFALSHQGAVPVDFFAPSPPDHPPAPPASAAAVTVPLASYLLFRSRAPPTG
jgi:hypothetical protein